MSARITIQSGIAAGTSHRIDRRVARVGSDPQSDVCLPTAEIPGHALTLEFRDDGCRVYNRCRDSVYVGAQVVPPDQVVDWPDTDILALGSDIELLLDLDVEHEEPIGFEQYDDPTITAENDIDTLPNRSSSGAAAKTTMQLAVTVLCVIGCVLLLARDQNRKSVRKAGPLFSEVVAQGLEGDTSSELLRRLQHAESQRIRGNERAAVIAFGRLRDDLVPQRERFETDQRQLELDVLQLVQSRLEELSE